MTKVARLGCFKFDYVGLKLVWEGKLNLGLFGIETYI